MERIPYFYDLTDQPFICDALAFYADDDTPKPEYEWTGRDCERTDSLLHGGRPDEVVFLQTEVRARTPLKNSGMLYAVICAGQACRVYLMTDGANREAVFLNSEIKGIANDNVMLHLDLVRGRNIVAVRTYHDAPSAFLMRICTAESDAREMISVWCRNQRLSVPRVHVLDHGYTPLKRGVYEFCLLPVTSGEIDVSYPVCVEVMENAGRRVLAVSYVPFCKWESIDLTKIDYPRDDINYLTVRFLYRTYHHGEWLESRMFSFYPMEENVQAFGRYLSLLQKKEHLWEMQATGVAFAAAEYADKAKDSIGILPYILSVRARLDKMVHTQRSLYYYTPGTTYLYLPSKLDGRIIRIPVKIPIGYSPDRSYPLLIHYDLSPYDETCSGFQTDKAIVMNMTGRGFTFGGYVGEATFFEILSFVRQFYSVDESRIFGIGHCSAGVALLNLAQNHPHLFSGLLVSDCPSVPREIRNLENLPIILLRREASPPREGETARPSPAASLESLANCTVYTAKAMTHSMMNRCYIQHHLVSELLCRSRSLFPSRIRFRSFGGRYRRAFWIDVIGRLPTYTDAFVSADILSETYIKISVEGALGVALSIPPQVNADRFSVEVNGCVFAFCGRRPEERLRFVRQDGQYHFCDGELPDGLIYDGLGIPDVYETPLLIWNRHPENRRYQQTALAFSSPHANAYVSEICVSYPIVTDMDPQALYGHSAVILDDAEATENPVLSAVRSRLQIICSHDGFSYRGIFYPGAYCVMQITDNPYSQDCSVLHICCNRDELLHENIFTRRLILPSLSSGEHPYLNNVALIYRQHGYFRIRSSGEDLVPCTNDGRIQEQSIRRSE